MSSHAVLNGLPPQYVAGKALEEMILSHIEEQTVIGLDTLVLFMPEYSWNQIFYAIDQLARHGAITLRRHRSEYILFSAHYAA